MSNETKIPGVKSAHQMVTPVCRANRGIDAAFAEALARIKKTYTQLAGSPHNDGVTWHLVLVREDLALTGETGTQNHFECQKRGSMSEPQKLTLKDFKAQMAVEKQMKTDIEIDTMSSGEFYHYMLDKNGFEWARQANRMANLGLDADAEHALGTWFANAQMAMTDRQHADYIRLRLDAEQAEDQPA